MRRKGTALTRRTKRYKPFERTFFPENEGCHCSSCPLAGPDGTPLKPVLWKPSRRAKLAIVGEGPGPIEEIRGEYFVGPSGHEVAVVLHELDVPGGAVTLNNCTKCKPRKKLSVVEWKKAAACCWPLLEKELLASGAKFVIGLGKWTQWVFRGKRDPIHDWCGSPYPTVIPHCRNEELVAELQERRAGTKRKATKTEVAELKKPVARWSGTVITTYHPAFALRGKRQYLPVFAQHMEFAWELASGIRKLWKWPAIYVKDDAAAMGALKRMWRDVKSGKIKRLGIDIETNGSNPVVDSMTKVGLSSRTVAISLSWPLRQDAVPLVKKILAHPVAVAAHNGVHDLIGFNKEGYEVNGYDFDTIIQHAIWMPTLLHRLQFACCTEFPMPAWKKAHKDAGRVWKNRSWWKPKTPEEWIAYGIYNAKDAYMTLILSYSLERRLRDEVDNWKSLYGDRLALSLISMEMRKTGVLLHKKNLAMHLKSFRRRRYEAGLELRKLAAATRYGKERSRRLNPNSDPQIKDFFFRHLRARPTHFSVKTGQPSLNDKTRQHLSLHPKESIAKAAQIMIRFKRWDTRLRMVRKLTERRTEVLNADGQCWGAKTGRWTYRDPNMTTFAKPKYRKSADGKKDILVSPGLRDILMARPHMRFVECDYSQIELRVMGILTNDELLRQWYREERDVHTENAKRWFRTNNPSDFQRDFSKTLVFAINYGGGAKTIWENLVAKGYHGFQLHDIEKFITVWYIHHPAIRQWQTKILAEATDTGQIVIPLSGKVVQMYGEACPDPPKVYNPPVQGSAAAIIDAAIQRVWPKLKRKEGENLLLQIHDALVGESPNPRRLATLFKTEMEKPVILNGKSWIFPADVKVGKTFGKMRKVTL